jgi:hypothetical protein
VVVRKGENVLKLNDCAKIIRRNKMKDSDFRRNVKESVKNLADLGLTEDKAFVLYAASEILGIDEEIAFDCVRMGGRGDLGLDFGYIEERDREIILIQGKYRKDIERDWIRNFEALLKILADSKKVRERGANTEVKEFARAYHRVAKNGYEVNAYFFHMGTISGKLKKEFVHTQYWGFNKIKNAYEERQSLMFPKKPERIEFELADADKQFKLEDRPGKPRCIVSTISLKTLWDLYQEYKSGLFDDNIRLHVGHKTPANRGMYSTLVEHSGKEASNFVFYNNGISILCESIKTSEKKKLKPRPGSMTLVLEKPQIVNGAQTTYTVGRLDEDMIVKEATVLVKILCPPKREPEEFREKVIRFNNTQTPVTSRDFRSNDTVQKKMFDTLDKWNPRYFYERKRGFWQSLSDKQRAHYRKAGTGKGRAQANFRIIDNEVMAQCMLAWEGQPARAKNDKRLIFLMKSENGIYEDVFPDGCHKPDSCQLYILGYELNDLFLKKRKLWGLKFKKAFSEDNKQAIKELEPNRFVLHFNFFGVASIGYIYNTHFEEKHRDNYKILFKQPYFDKMFEFLKKIFRAEMRARIAAAKEIGTSFNINYWFKNDGHFDESIKAAIDDHSNDIPRPD